uniref:Uncharacterized protein n=1 Tax=Romanomermis culicivorax TaxID=13658 RepID=A0A915HJ71_ROMCU
MGSTRGDSFGAVGDVSWAGAGNLVWAAADDVSWAVAELLDGRNCDSPIGNELECPSGDVR